MATLREKLLPAVNKLRRLPQTFGVRLYSVTLRRRRFTDGTPGLGAFTILEERTIDPAPRVRQLSAREVAAAPGTYEEGDLRVDRITPDHATGGYTPAELHVRPQADDEDVIVELTGDEGTRVGTYVRGTFDGAFGYSFVVRLHRVQP